MPAGQPPGNDGYLVTKDNGESVELGGAEAYLFYLFGRTDELHYRPADFPENDPCNGPFADSACEWAVDVLLEGGSAEQAVRVYQGYLRDRCSLEHRSGCGAVQQNLADLLNAIDAAAGGAGLNRAAESESGLTFAVDSAGDTTVSLRTAAGDTFEFSPHSLERLAQRGVSIDDASALLGDSSKSFQYFHDGAWKTGFYDPSSRLFIGTANGNVTTVIGNASQNYINNLMAAQP